jgi:hypothetical protein
MFGKRVKVDEETKNMIFIAQEHSVYFTNL